MLQRSEKPVRQRNAPKVFTPEWTPAHNDSKARNSWRSTHLSTVQKKHHRSQVTPSLHYLKNSSQSVEQRDQTVETRQVPVSVH